MRQWAKHELQTGDQEKGKAMWAEAREVFAQIGAQMEAEEAYAHAEAVAQRRVIAARHGVEIAKTKGTAAEEEIAVLTQQLDELDKEKTLDMYVARRSAEVLAQARHHYVRRDR